jgi:acetamidase/formamidase
VEEVSRLSVYSIEPERAALHGAFRRDAEPVLTVESGDTVVFRTLDAGWNLGAVWAGYPEGVERKFAPRDPDKDGGHCLCGPIAISGASPGMTLEVRIGEIVPGNWGWTAAGGWPHDVHVRLGMLDREGWLRWNIDAQAMTARNQYGHEVALRPFLGVMGMPTDEPGLLATSPPRRTGGNLDCKELTAGASLFLPIEVEGGLFSAGDGHAAQGDGESCVTAIECPMERAELTFVLQPELRLRMPRARTDEGWLTLGLHAELQEAAYLALDDMLDLMTERYEIDRPEAHALASVVVDLRITQMVNGVRGVHAVLPHGAVKNLHPR